MTFISTYHEAMQIANEMDNGKCSGRCRTTWMRNLKYALTAKTNPLALTKVQRKNLTENLHNRKKRPKTLKKYTMRKSPPYPANDYCNQQMVGNDGQLYISRADKRGICSWKKL